MKWITRERPKIDRIATPWLIKRFIASLFAQTAAPTYPKIAAYVGILHPLVTISSDGTHANFDGSYTVGMPTGINIWKSAGIGFSMEMVPTIRVENGVSKMNNFLFHPGVLVALGHGIRLQVGPHLKHGQVRSNADT